MANGPTSHIYNCHRWRKLRLQILIRDGWRCQLCGVGLYRAKNGKRGNAAVDHITPLSQGGAPYDPANLRAICQADNTALSNRKLPKVIERRYPVRRAWWFLP